MRTGRGRLVGLVLLLVASLAIALPAVAAPPAHSNAPSEKPDKPGKPEKPEKPGKPDKPGKPNKPDTPAKANRSAEVPLSLTGVVVQTSDEKGRPTFTITVDGVTWELSAGPKWFWRDGNPLAAWVGQTVDVAGTHVPGELELDVQSINGGPLREPGKPSWAGGPKVVGEAHPGWHEWKADRPRGAAGAPGQLKRDDGEPQTGEG